MFDFVEEAVGREVKPGRSLTEYKNRPQQERDDEEEKEP